jgi:hypothetical protein
LIDAETGHAILDQNLEPVSDLQAIQTLRFEDQFYLFVSGPVQPQFKSIGQPGDYPIINGQVYAFNLKSGEALWPGPATVRNRGIILQQPPDIPLLVFADRQMTRDAMSGGGSQLRLLCLDRRTGETAYRNDALPDTSIARFRIRGETDSRPAVAVEMNAGKIQLTMTDRPRPPQPPANDDLEASREIAERGLIGLGKRFGTAFSNALDRPAPLPPIQPRAVQGQQPQRLPQPAIKALPQGALRPAPKPTPATDDD